MVTAENTLDHLAHAASFGAGLSVDFDTVPHWGSDASTIASGTLDVFTTRSIHERYAEAHADVLFGAQPVPILVCLATLERTNGGASIPVLLLPGLLEADGTLCQRLVGRPWIPLSLLDDGSSLGNSALAVCDLDAYRAHQIAMDALPQDASWQNAVHRAYDLFTAVNSLSGEQLRALGLRLHTNRCTLRIWEEDDPAATCGSLLSNAMSSWGEDDGGNLASCLLTEDNHPQATEEAHEDASPDNMVLGRLLATGMPDHIEGLTPQDREAFSVYARQEEGDLLTVCAPMGTHRVSMALAAMGQVLTERALRGERAPFMLCVAPANSLASIMAEMDNRPTAGLTALSSRWIPRIAANVDYRGNPREGERRTLGPLGSVVALHTRGDAGSYRGMGQLTHPLGHFLDGAAATYADVWYIPRATTYYLDCVSSFLGQRVRDVHEAATLLGERLRHVDQDRSELIGAYEDVCNASSSMRQREDLVNELGRLRRDHQIKRKRMNYWLEVLERHPSKRAIVGRTQPSQAEIVSKYALDHETLVQGCATVEEVCNAYRAEVDVIESTIDRLRGNAAELSRSMKAAASKANQCTEAISRLVDACNLSFEQASVLESVMDGREADRDRLDHALDQTIRPAEFWLSIHIFEAQWLESNSRGMGFARLAHGDLRKGYELLSQFCPIQLIDVELVPSLLSGLGDKSSTTTPIDLLVIMDAQTVDVATGLTLLHSTKRALVLGAKGNLRNQPLYGLASEELLASQTLEPRAWQTLQERRLTLTGSSSLYDALAHKKDQNDMVSLTNVSNTYGELTDFRSDLVPDEQLQTRRMPANFADDPHYPLARIVPSLSYVLVPDSAWKSLGTSRKNDAEALAIIRWLHTRVQRIQERYGDVRSPLIAVTSPYVSQTELLRRMVLQHHDAFGDVVEVVRIGDLEAGHWPIVVFSSTSGPDNHVKDIRANLESVLSCTAAAAQDALIVFCSGAWVKSTLHGPSVLIKRALRMGRLFSVERRAGTIRRGNGSHAQGEVDPHTKANLQPNVELRVKPCALTRLLASMEQRGVVGEVPPTHLVNRALERAGLIERFISADGRQGWRPTASGREIGILPSTDRLGNPFCSYTSSVEPVLQSIIEGMSKQGQNGDHGDTQQ